MVDGSVGDDDHAYDGEGDDDDDHGDDDVLKEATMRNHRTNTTNWCKRKYHEHHIF